jgi:hypothetical protein
VVAQSYAWWSVLSAVLTLGGEVWSGIAVDAPWDAERGYEIGAYQPRDGGGWMIDCEGRLTRIKQLTPIRNPESIEDLRKGTAVHVFATLIDAQGAEICRSGGRADPVTGRFTFVLSGRDSPVRDGQPVQVKITVKVDQETKSTVTVPGTIRFLKRPGG